MSGRCRGQAKTLVAGRAISSTAKKRRRLSCLIAVFWWGAGGGAGGAGLWPSRAGSQPHKPRRQHRDDGQRPLADEQQGRSVGADHDVVGHEDAIYQQGGVRVPAPGLAIEFTAEVDKKHNVKEAISSVTVVSLGSDRLAGLFPEGSASSGPKSAEADNFAFGGRGRQV